MEFFISTKKLVSIKKIFIIFFLLSQKASKIKFLMKKILLEVKRKFLLKKSFFCFFRIIKGLKYEEKEEKEKIAE